MSGGLDHRRARGLVRFGLVAAVFASLSMSGAPPALGASSGLANPADRHCLDNQYELVRIHDDDGVAGWSLCVDRRNNRKCESWAFFRGECSLGGAEGSLPGHHAPPRLGGADETRGTGIDDGGASPSLECCVPTGEALGSGAAVSIGQRDGVIRGSSSRAARRLDSTPALRAGPIETDPGQWKGSKPRGRVRHLCPSPSP